MLDLPTNPFNAYKLQGSLLAIMDLEKCSEEALKSSVKLKNQLKIYFKQAFDILLLDLPQAFTKNIYLNISAPAGAVIRAS